ncbi:MAG: class C sortase [Lachnospiraceae bacterium]|nr:class C sortase [Lachnospiraceae bacterium]
MKAKNNKTKSGIRVAVRVLALLLLLAGITALVYPYALQFLYNRQAGDDYKHFVEELPDIPAAEEQVKQPVDTAEDIPYLELYRKMQAYNSELYLNGQAELTDPWAYEQTSFQLTEYGFEENIIGYIEIPKIDVVLPIYLGASNANMKKGAAHLSQTSLPIGGKNTNSVICAHRGFSTATMFNHLVDLEEGNEVIITNLWYTMTYRVTETTTIQSDEVDKLIIQDGKELLTLFTCYYQSGRKDRFVVYCERHLPSDTSCE